MAKSDASNHLRIRLDCVEIPVVMVVLIEGHDFCCIVTGRNVSEACEIEGTRRFNGSLRLVSICASALRTLSLVAVEIVINLLTNSCLS